MNQISKIDWYLLILLHFLLVLLRYLWIILWLFESLQLWISIYIAILEGLQVMVHTGCWCPHSLVHRHRFSLHSIVLLTRLYFPIHLLSFWVLVYFTIEVLLSNPQSLLTLLLKLSGLTHRLLFTLKLSIHFFMIWKTDAGFKVTQVFLDFLDMFIIIISFILRNQIHVLLHFLKTHLTFFDFTRDLVPEIL